MSAITPVIDVRAPRVRDRSRVRHLVAATDRFRQDEIDVAVEVFDDATREPGVDYHGLAAYQGDGLVGFTLFGPVACTVATWDLYWIVVDPDVQGQGIGRRLLQRTESAIRSAGGRLIVVETSSRPDYAATRKFYEAVGYRRAAEIADYYAAGEALVVYSKNLDPPTTEMAPYG
ncbi:MAG: GNAT family N-acetyltransferase [Gemmatimonadales bacterium]|jgi:ribosomal protein S18 acetylase RimI-like enzyme